MYELIAKPRTWGELKAAISDIPDDALIVWINQPLQDLYEWVPKANDDDPREAKRVFGFQ